MWSPSNLIKNRYTKEELNKAKAEEWELDKIEVSNVWGYSACTGEIGLVKLMRDKSDGGWRRNDGLQVEVLEEGACAM